MSLSKLRPTKIAEICNGYWLNEDIPQFAFHHVVIDSRQMAGNSLFIALKGAHRTWRIYRFAFRCFFVFFSHGAVNRAQWLCVGAIPSETE